MKSISAIGGSRVTNLGREDEFVEFKQSTAELDKSLASLASMLNKHGKARIYFGVRDDGEVVGQNIGKSTLKDISQAVANFIDPSVIPEISVLDSDDDKKYISVYAEGYDRPYLFKGAIYIRSGEEDRKASANDLRKMILSSGDLLKDTLSINQDLKFSYLLNMLKEKGMSVKDSIPFFRSLGLMNSEGKFNKQAEILSDMNPHHLTVATFSGMDRTKLITRKEFGGCLLSAVRSVLDYIESSNEKFVDVTGPVRKEEDLFYYPAFKEAWVNACVHNNWVGQIPPAVYFFDDRIEILSYGDKPYWLTEDAFFEGESMPVNESLMRLFITAGLSEHTGHGVPVVVETYGRGVYQFSGGSITVTIPFLHPRSAARYRAEDSEKCLGKKEMLILAAMKAHPEYTLDKISSITGIARATVGKTVPELRKRGYIERKGSLRDGIWIVHADL